MFDNKKMIGILLSAIAVISLITYTVVNGTGNVVTGAFNDAGAWVGRIFSHPVNLVVDFVESVDNLMNTFDENQRLKEKLNTIDELQVRVADLETENEKMRETLELDQILSQFTTVNATVISRSPDQWTETLMIDAGKNHGIEKDMAVMAGNGLIGRVIEVNLLSSKVQLLTAQQARGGLVSARIQTQEGEEGGTSVSGIISSYDPNSGNYKMTQVAPDAAVKTGDMVITSGLGDVIPSSLLIGEVVDSYMDDYGLFKVVEVKPAGKTIDIRFVTIIQREGQREEE